MPRRIFGIALFTLILLFSTGSSNAQLRSTTEPTEIRGQVRYARGNAPVVDALVRLESLAGGYVGEERTDRLGKFRFSNLLPIQYFVSIRQPGYQEIRREVNLVMIPSDYIQIQLLSDETDTGSATIYSPKIIDANVPAEARREFERAQAAFANGKKSDEAILHLERAIRLYPKFAEAELQLGTAYMDLKQWEPAEQALRRAIELNPKIANADFALGALYLEQQRFEEAERALRKGLELENRSWQGHYTLGRVYWTRKGNGDLQRAAKQVALALQLNDNFADAHLLAGNIFLQAKRRDEALEEFQTYRRLAPKGPYADQTRETVKRLRNSEVKKST